MKSILSILLTFYTGLSMVACSNDTNDTATDSPVVNDFTLQVCEIEHEDPYSIVDVEFVDTSMVLTRDCA